MHIYEDNTGVECRMAWEECERIGFESNLSPIADDAIKGVVYTVLDLPCIFVDEMDLR